MKRAALALAVALISAGPVLAAGGMERAEQPGMPSMALPEGLGWVLPGQRLAPEGWAGIAGSPRAGNLEHFPYQSIARTLEGVELGQASVPQLLGSLDAAERRYRADGSAPEARMKARQMSIALLRAEIKSRLQAVPEDHVLRGRAGEELEARLAELRKSLSPAVVENFRMGLQPQSAARRHADLVAATGWLGREAYVSELTASYVLVGQRNAPNLGAAGLALAGRERAAALRPMIDALNRERRMLERRNPDLAGPIKGAVLRWRINHGWGPRTAREKALLKEIGVLERQRKALVADKAGYEPPASGQVVPYPALLPRGLEAGVMQYGVLNSGQFNRPSHGLPSGVAEEISAGLARKIKELDGRLEAKMKELKELRGH
ncbi:MAG: hypothetical protein KGO96_01085 [Elusimicrobia bacterium]|nr:hypothetical protein [Elusimicrobiota bacterium]MDE2424488.1 hypothetical protein [Elusimicrobiota bacterium]